MPNGHDVCVLTFEPALKAGGQARENVAQDPPSGLAALPPRRAMGGAAKGRFMGGLNRSEPRIILPIGLCGQSTRAFFGVLMDVAIEFAPKTWNTGRVL
jgi:hypothetical protein